jgi:hypothetical protein
MDRNDTFRERKKDKERWIETINDDRPNGRKITKDLRRNYLEKKEKEKER